MNWKFIFRLLKSNSIFINFRIILFFSQKHLRKRSFLSDHLMLALPALIPFFLIIRKFVQNEDFGLLLILPLILLMIIPAHLFIKRNERIVLNSHPEIHTLLDSNRKEFLTLWILHLILFCSLCIIWYLGLVHFIFAP